RKSAAKDVVQHRAEFSGYDGAAGLALLLVTDFLGAGQRAEQRMQARREHAAVLLNELDEAVERKFLRLDIGRDGHALLDRSARQRKFIHQPIAEVRDVAAAFAVEANVVLVARIPMRQAIEKRAEIVIWQILAVLRAENSDRVLRAAHRLQQLFV